MFCVIYALNINTTNAQASANLIFLPNEEKVHFPILLVKLIQFATGVAGQFRIRDFTEADK